MAKRIQLSRKKGYRKPPDAVNVARPTKWGNPYKVVGNGDAWYVLNTVNGQYIGSPHATKRKALERCLYYFEKVHLKNKKREIAQELAGKDLACWCKLDEPCHADVLLRLANKRLAPERLILPQGKVI